MSTPFSAPPSFNGKPGGEGVCAGVPARFGSDSEHFPTSLGCGSGAGTPSQIGDRKSTTAINSVGVQEASSFNSRLFSDSTSAFSVNTTCNNNSNNSSNISLPQPCPSPRSSSSSSSSSFLAAVSDSSSPSSSSRVDRSQLMSGIPRLTQRSPQSLQPKISLPSIQELLLNTSRPRSPTRPTTVKTTARTTATTAAKVIVPLVSGISTPSLAASSPLPSYCVYGPGSNTRVYSSASAPLSSPSESFVYSPQSDATHRNHSVPPMESTTCARFWPTLPLYQSPTVTQSPQSLHVVVPPSPTSISSTLTPSANAAEPGKKKKKVMTEEALLASKRMRYARWTSVEDAVIYRHLEIYGPHQWDKVADYFEKAAAQGLLPGPRNYHQCRQRYLKTLSKQIDRHGRLIRGEHIISAQKISHSTPVLKAL